MENIIEQIAVEPVSCCGDENIIRTECFLAMLFSFSCFLARFAYRRSRSDLLTHLFSSIMFESFQAQNSLKEVVVSLNLHLKNSSMLLSKPRKTASPNITCLLEGVTRAQAW